MQPLTALTPVTVVPATRRGSETTATIDLKRIEFVRVSPVASRGNSHVYGVEIYHNTTPSPNSSSQIPTSNLANDDTAIMSTTTSSNSSSFCSATSLMSRTEAHKSQAHVERSYADFLSLQAQLLRCVHVAHTMVPCAFCRETTGAASWGGTHSSPLAMLIMKEDELAATFENCVNEILTLMKTRFPSKRGPCSAQTHVSAVLYEFLCRE